MLHGHARKIYYFVKDTKKGVINSDVDNKKFFIDVHKKTIVRDGKLWASKVERKHVRQRKMPF